VSPVRTNRKLVAESAALGVGYAALLIWIGSAFVGSFGAFDDAYPYWPAISGLRTDTAGALAFAVSIVTLVISRYLQLRRRNGAVPRPEPAERPAAVLAVLAVADVAAVLATAVVIYLSLNAATHPWTLPMQLTHLLPSGPSEGTVRVVALGICLVSIALRRYLRAADTAAPAQADTTAAPAKTDTAAASATLETAASAKADTAAQLGPRGWLPQCPVVRPWCGSPPAPSGARGSKDWVIRGPRRDWGSLPPDVPSGRPGRCFDAPRVLSFLAFNSGKSLGGFSAK
jgi:hypothetical protein